MKLTFADVLQVLPVDDTLKTYLSRCRLSLPDTLDWSDNVATSQQIIDAIQSCADSAIRDRITSGLHTATQLTHAKANSAMFQVAIADGAVLIGLAACTSNLHRAFWLLVHHPEVFERACDLDYVDSHAGQTQQINLGVRLAVHRDQDSMDGFCNAIKQFYKHALHCGDIVVGNLMDRAHNTQLVTLRV